MPVVDATMPYPTCRRLPALPTWRCRLAPQTANPFASSFFTPGTTAAERLSAPVLGDRRGLALPPLPGLRTSGACKSPGKPPHEPLRCCCLPLLPGPLPGLVGEERCWAGCRVVERHASTCGIAQLLADTWLALRCLGCRA